MKCMYIAAVAAALVSATVLTGCEKKEPTLGEKIEQAAKDTAKAAEKTAKDVEKAAEKVAEDAADAVKEATK